MDQKSNALQGPLRVIRIALLVAGGGMIAVALAADLIGLSLPGSFGGGQLLLLVVGLIVAIVGFLFSSVQNEQQLRALGRRVAGLYRGIAIIIINTLVLFGCLELGASVALRLPFFGGSVTEPRVSYYASRPWSAAYWRDMAALPRTTYKPYVIWSRPPYEGEAINVDSNGTRMTPGADCSANAYKVFTFGGSAMWGYGVPDWGTIAAYLQTELESVRDDPVCVMNFGEMGYVSTQGVIVLMTQLQSGNVPDLVIFHDGANDVYAAYRYEQPGAHFDLDEIAASFEGQDNLLISWLEGTRTYILLRQLLAGSNQAAAQEEALRQNPGEALRENPGEGLQQAPERDTESAAASTVQVYLTNYRIVGALAQEYGFEYAFFLQPVIGIGKKPLTDEEQQMLEAMPTGSSGHYKAAYQQIEQIAPDYEHLYYLADIFEDEPSQMYTDGVHVAPEGNELIAQEMLDLIGDQVREE